MYVRTDVKSGSACYTVQSGDSLSTISQKFYGNMNSDNVAKIYYSNQATIGPNPNIVQPGQQLYIPD
jgi:nucleoid-associated protein YgaU